MGELRLANCEERLNVEGFGRWSVGTLRFSQGRPLARLNVGKLEG
jgi:hypothetical protein